MPALPEYRTRMLLENCGVPLVGGRFIAPGDRLPEDLPAPPVYLKAQIPGATGRKAMGLVRKVETGKELRGGVEELLSPVEHGMPEGVLVTEGLDLRAEYYAGCTLDFGSRDRQPGGILLFSAQGGSGVEGRSSTLLRMSFSLLRPPSAEEIACELASIDGITDRKTAAAFLEGLVRTFMEYRLTVLEVNPAGLLSDGSLIAVDCRAEFEQAAVAKRDMELFRYGGGESQRLTPLEKAAELVNGDDPSGTGFFRQNRETPPDGALRVATNLCGGGGKMLWEMAAGGRDDIYTMNESDTSGGLSAFKSYRLLRVILAQEGAQVLLLTGSGMAFQNQHHLAAAVWKALKESPTPLPSLLRFGGTDEDRARDLFERAADSLPVAVRTYPPEVFPNAMVEDLFGIFETASEAAEGFAPPVGGVEIPVESPPGLIRFFPDRWKGGGIPPSIAACPTGFLVWNEGEIGTDPEARCIGCLMCETAALLEGDGEAFVQLDMPGEVDR